jgi:hypothetical protein
VGGGSAAVIIAIYSATVVPWPFFVPIIVLNLHTSPKRRNFAI